MAWSFPSFQEIKKKKKKLRVNPLGPNSTKSQTLEGVGAVSLGQVGFSALAVHRGKVGSVGPTSTPGPYRLTGPLSPLPPLPPGGSTAGLAQEPPPWGQGP